MNAIDAEAERAEALSDAFVQLTKVSRLILESRQSIRKKPILGGVFGHCGFELCSISEVHSGLDMVMFYVADTSGMAFGMGYTKQQALTFARTVLTHVSASEVQAARAVWHSIRVDMERQRIEAEKEQIRRLRDDSEEEEDRAQKVRSIPRRRRRIFDESGGKCHYCEAVLTLDGKWHVEHKMPKALGGGNEPGNLVASCVSCNMKKRDTTDQEFKARLAKEKSA